MRLIFFILFIIVPVIEIYLFIKVGGLIGAGNTILIIIVTAIVGAAMLRSQGMQTLARIQQSLQQFQLPAMEMMEGVLIVIGGAFLLTPGFFTDSIGFLCLVPATRRIFVGLVIGIFGNIFSVSRRKSSYFQSSVKPSSGNKKSRIIEGEFTEEPDDKKRL